jgi:hypothetical protein
MSAADSITQPKAQSIIPAMSREVGNVGLDPPFLISDTEGELRILKGSDTVQTCWGVSGKYLLSRVTYPENLTCMYALSWEKYTTCQRTYQSKIQGT